MYSFKFEVVSLNDVPLSDERAEVTLPSKPLVLVVDDEPLVADSLRLILSFAGYEAMTAYRASAALELAKKRAPALLISDVSMPEMSGVELAIAMCALVPKCGILLFSGHATSKDLIRAREAGYNFPLLRKPVPPEEILRHVSQALREPDRRHVSGSMARGFSMKAFAESA